ncbi:MAG: TIGR04282 family arsenosugar biosynthesis glycosyltransferase, partial [Planctomycetota bacterium]
MRLAVFAKAPVPGRVKTRLCPPLSPGQAADLYAAFLADTLERLGAHAGARGIRLVVAHDGEERAFLPLAPPGARFRPQRGEG